MARKLDMSFRAMILFYVSGKRKANLMDFWFWFGLTTSWITMAIALSFLIHISNQEEQRQRRTQCMTNHPAGKRVQTEPLLSGQTNPISPNTMFPAYHGEHSGINYGKLARDIQNGKLQRHISSEVSCSAPHHLEDDK